MLSDLSLGDKLSLKGKIFELSKRLNLIEMEKHQNDELPYHTVFTRNLHLNYHSALSAFARSFDLFEHVQVFAFSSNTH